jgi:hypothetical protein
MPTGVMAAPLRRRTSDAPATREGVHRPVHDEGRRPQSRRRARNGRPSNGRAFRSSQARPRPGFASDNGSQRQAGSGSGGRGAASAAGTPRPGAARAARFVFILGAACLSAATKERSELGAAPPGRASQGIRPAGADARPGPPQPGPEPACRRQPNTNRAKPYSTAPPRSDPTRSAKRQAPSAKRQAPSAKRKK